MKTKLVLSFVLLVVLSSLSYYFNNLLPVVTTHLAFEQLENPSVQTDTGQRLWSNFVSMPAMLVTWLFVNVVLFWSELSNFVKGFVK